MVEFNLWFEAFIFIFSFTFIIAVPCVLVALIGRKMISQLGLHPSTSAVIDVGTFLKLIVIEVITFLALIGFYRFFSSK